MSSDNAESVGEVWMSHPNCNSTSMDINDCAVTKGVLAGCNGHVWDLLLKCDTKYDFRLAPINDHDAEGLVEMKVKNTWALVSSDNRTFSDETAKVICATLGYGYTGFSTSSFPGLNVSSYTGYFFNKLFECTGTETRATECVTGDWVPEYQATRTEYLTRLHCYEYLVTDIRLQGGVLPNEGRFEVQVDGRWGSVCVFSLAYGSFNLPAMCRLLGYETDSSVGPPSMSNDNAEHLDEVWMSNPNCNSTSKDINDCAVTKGGFDACKEHRRDLKLRCVPIRDGRQIEAEIRGHLYSFCSDGFDINAANVTCTFLGYYGVNRLLTADHKGTDIYNGTIMCNGMEKSLESCDLVDSGMINCKQADVAYMECHVAGKIIPSNNKAYEGAFFAYYMYRWMRIGTDVSDVTAKTICSLLGFGYNGYAVTVYDYINGRTDILTYMSCKGHESDMAECASNIYGPGSCGPCRYCPSCPSETFGTVNLYCSDYSIDGIRLVDGQSSTEGVIQVLVDGEWGHICAIGWNTTATNIACKTRGFKSGVGFHSVDIANASILIGHVECQGSESNLNQCTYRKKGYYEHKQSCNNTIAIACITECDVAWYGQSCSTMCSCNANNSETSVNGRACDNVTGECACKKAWSGATCDDDANECLDTLICQEANTQCKNTVGGYECICAQGYEVNDNGTCVLVGTKTDISMLVIVVSSGVGGLLFIIVVATICFCTLRRRHPQGELKDTPKKLPDSRVANSNVLATSIRSTTNEEEYDTIKDGSKRDALDVNALRVASHHNDGYHRDNQNTTYHTHTGLKIEDNDGYIDLNAKEHCYTGLKTDKNRKFTKNYDYPYINNRNKNKPLRAYPNENVMPRQLTDVPLESDDTRREAPANRAEMKGHYQGLVGRRLGENVYERKLDEDGYMRPIVSSK